jgi:3-deoxy-manno-octulosonate cytidylyltransferase (CMP-KDO synthetase)
MSIIIIPSRLAATRLPNKPLALIKGMPMIYHVWQRAMEAEVGEVVIACCDEKLFDVVTKFGGKAVMTDHDLASLSLIHI